MKQLFWRRYIDIIGWFARRYLDRTKPYIIGITGSVGKTTCRMIVTQTLVELFPEKRIVSSPKNFNGELGFLLSVFDMTQFGPSVGNFVTLFFRGLWYAFFSSEVYDVFVGEYGIDSLGEMAFLTSVARPHTAIVTKIDHVHGKQLGGLESTAHEKGGLVSAALDLVFLNNDDDFVKTMTSRTRVDVFYFGLNDLSSHHVTDLTYDYTDDAFVSHALYHMGEANHAMQSNICADSEHVYVSIGLSLAGLLAHRWSLELILPLAMHYDIQPGRCSFLSGMEESVILDSSYNAAPASMAMILDFAEKLHDGVFEKRELILLLGEMRELGEVAEQKHQELAEQIISVGPALVVLVGEMMQVTYTHLLALGYASDTVLHVRDARLAGRHILEYMRTSKDVRHFIVVKGSQNTIYLEEGIKELLQHSADSSYLGRQEQRWMEKKNAWFESLSSE